MCFRKRHCLLLPALLLAAAVLLSPFGRAARSQAAKPQVAITPNAVLAGMIQWVEAPPKGAEHFAYAILYFDGEPRGVNNTLPLRFDLDSTKVSDGFHTIKVVFFDANEKIAEVITPVLVANTPRALTEAKPMPVVTPAPQAAAQARSLTVFLQDHPLEFSLPPYISENRAMVMLRPLTRAAGGALDWQGNTGTTVINQRTIRFTLNSPVAMLDGEPVRLNRPLVMRNYRVFAPVSLWSDLFAGNTSYDPLTRSIFLGEIGTSLASAK